MEFGCSKEFCYSNQLVAIGGYAAARKAIPTGNLTSAYNEAMQQFVQPLT